MFCSTIIPTIGRPALNRAVESVLDQSLPGEEFEVIVVNDSGRPLPEAGWQGSVRVRVIETQRRERSVARNTGAAIARGRYLHFLDDDDWLLPGALHGFAVLARSTEADWLYGGSQLVDRQGQALIQLHHGFAGNCFIQVMAGEWIPLQASLIAARAFFAAGGFNPRITGPEDIDLCRRITLHGDVAGTTAIVACIGMGTENSTTDYDRSPQYSRWAREAILAEPGVFGRMRASAHTPFWQGRLARVYLTSAVWNFREKRPLVGLSRLFFGAAGLAMAGGGLLAKDFWRAIAGPYVSETFRRGFREAGLPEAARTISG